LAGSCSDENAMHCTQQPALTRFAAALRITDIVSEFGSGYFWRRYSRSNLSPYVRRRHAATGTRRAEGKGGERVTATMPNVNHKT